MTARAQLVLAAAFCGLGLAELVSGVTETWLCVAMGHVLATGVAIPRLTLRLLLLTASCDLVLTMQVADAFTVRLAHLCAAVLATRLVVERARTRAAWPVPRRALQPMVLYLVVAALSSARSENLGKSVGYWGWAAFDLVALFAVLLEATRTQESFDWALRWWTGGVVAAGAMGLVQLGTGFAHLPVPLLRQWVGGYPRINGFNYEPAYFALYLESAAAPLLIYGLVARRRGWALLAGALLVPAALCMSRSGWLGMSLLLGYAFLRMAVAQRWTAAISLALVAGTSVTTALVTFPPDFLSEAPRMAAMALDAEEVSSSAPRLDMLEQARKVFVAEPVLGVGLGGYGGYVLAHPELMLASQPHEPERIITTNLWLELASETGVLGVFAVLWFLIVLLASLGQVIYRGAPEDAAWAEAFFVAVVLVFAVLYQFNQTLWRMDVWVLLSLAWSVPLRATLRRVGPGTPERTAPLRPALAA